MDHPATPSKAATPVKAATPEPASRSTEASKSPEEPTPPPPKRRKVGPMPCIICGIEYTELYKVCTGGHHYWCNDCIADAFRAAITDPTRMPPRCCGMIPPYHGLGFLSEEERAVFRAKLEEWMTPNPTYCPVKTCSAFISPRILRAAANTTCSSAPFDSKDLGSRNEPTLSPSAPTAATSSSDQVTANHATLACPKCAANLCGKCHQLTHPDLTDCPVVELDQALAAMLTHEGYKSCPKCGHAVKKRGGCMHMVCVCGASWCWSCLQPLDEFGAPCECGAQEVCSDSSNEQEGEEAEEEGKGGEGDEEEDGEDDDGGIPITFDVEPSDGRDDTMWGCEHKDIGSVSGNDMSTEARRHLECMRCMKTLQVLEEVKASGQDDRHLSLAIQCDGCGLLICPDCFKAEDKN